MQSTAGFAKPLALVALVKCARFGAVLLAYDYLHAQGLPVRRRRPAARRRRAPHLR